MARLLLNSIVISLFLFSAVTGYADNEGPIKCPQGIPAEQIPEGMEYTAVPVAALRQVVAEYFYTPYQTPIVPNHSPIPNCPDTTLETENTCVPEDYAAANRGTLRNALTSRKSTLESVLKGLVEFSKAIDSWNAFISVRRNTECTFFLEPEKGIRAFALLHKKHEGVRVRDLDKGRTCVDGEIICETYRNVETVSFKDVVFREVKPPSFLPGERYQDWAKKVKRWMNETKDGRDAQYFSIALTSFCRGLNRCEGAYRALLSRGVFEGLLARPIATSELPFTKEDLQPTGFYNDTDKCPLTVAIDYVRYYLENITARLPELQ